MVITDGTVICLMAHQTRPEVEKYPTFLISYGWLYCSYVMEIIIRVLSELFCTQY